NNITRLLDSRGIDYIVYELPTEKLGALETATLINVQPEIVYKTIVISRQGKGKPILAVVPGISEVDLKLLAKVLNEKKLILPTEREAEKITGLQAGGISPLALINRGFEIIIDDSVNKHSEIHISGGQRGMNIRLPVINLIEILRAKVLRVCS
ncbi:MAG: YbaK/EbsC family protein, partial [Chloroflexota bacterium]